MGRCPVQAFGFVLWAFYSFGFSEMLCPRCQMAASQLLFFSSRYTSMATNQTADHPAAAWSELLGSNNWDGLLDPLDLNLRTLILRCGNFCQVTYDAFNNDQNSKYSGSSRYGKQSFFDKVMLQDAANCQASCFLYATAQVSVPEALLLKSKSRESWDRESNWIGYIAVTTDEVSKAIGRREIYVAWRGTIRNYEWINVMGAARVAWPSKLGTETPREFLASKQQLRGAPEGAPPLCRGLPCYFKVSPQIIFFFIRCSSLAA